MVVNHPRALQLKAPSKPSIILVYFTEQYNKLAPFLMAKKEKNTNFNPFDSRWSQVLQQQKQSDSISRLS